MLFCLIETLLNCPINSYPSIHRSLHHTSLIRICFLQWVMINTAHTTGQQAENKRLSVQLWMRRLFRTPIPHGSGDITEERVESIRATGQPDGFGHGRATACVSPQAAATAHIRSSHLKYQHGLERRWQNVTPAGALLATGGCWDRESLCALGVWPSCTGYPISTRS